MQSSSTLAKLVPTCSSWWEDEVSALLAAAPTLGPSARAAVRGVLHSLLGEATTDAATRIDAATLLAALGRPVLVRD